MPVNASVADALSVGVLPQGPGEVQRAAFEPSGQSEALVAS